MGSIVSRDNQPENAESNLKLEAQKVRDFSGNFSEWPKWKSRTECAFDGSGYEKILSDSDFAARHARMNKIVYSQLSAATVDGNAHHLVKAHDDEKDGNAAWQSLCEWYDGDVVQSETADEIRSKLDNLKLHTAISATQYLNQFLTWHSDIAKIPGEGLSPSHGVYLFLKNIIDPDYKATVQFCRNQTSTLNECVSAVRKTERDLLRQRAERRKMQQIARRIIRDDNKENFDNSESKSSERDDDLDNDNHPKRQKREIETNKKGKIFLNYKEWETLVKDEKTFINDWNRAIKNGDPTEELKMPEGITIVTKARRVENSEPKNAKTSRKRKRITFHLGDSVDTADEDD